MMRLCPIKYGVKVVPPSDLCADEVICLLNFRGNIDDEIVRTWTGFGFPGGVPTYSDGLILNGTNNYLSAPADSLFQWQYAADLDPLCFEAIINIDATPPNPMTIFSNNHVGAPLGMQFYMAEISGVRRLFFANMRSGAIAAPASMPIPVSTDVHVAVQLTHFDLFGVPKTKYAFCVNGVYYSTTHGRISKSNTTNTGASFIGTEPNGTGDYEGIIKAFRITRCERYTADFTPPTAPFPNP